MRRRFVPLKSGVVLAESCLSEEKGKRGMVGMRKEDEDGRWDDWAEAGDDEVWKLVCRVVSYAE